MLRDPDITQEQDRVKNVSNKDEMPVKIYGSAKNFGMFNKVTAVKQVSFGLEFGECFALLGISGAGKTTLFKCLTGEIRPSNGEMSINGQNILHPSGLAAARKHIGYCPQFDCQYDDLTVLEHLELYASIKGIKKTLRDRIVQKQMVDMDLKQYENVRSGQLSGGNRRKLSVSMAIMGNPPLIFLDEPSTGVDP